MNKENINKRLLDEIEELDCEKKFKKFLEELLLEENAGTLSYAYRDQYKKLINKYFSDNSNNSQ